MSDINKHPIAVLRLEAYNRLYNIKGFNLIGNDTDLDMYSWPQSFGGTAGPGGGFGGQTISKFNIWMFVSPCEKFAIAECCGRWKILQKGGFKPLMYVEF